MSVTRRSLPRRDASHRRVMVIDTSVEFAFLVLIGQLWYLQVLEGGRFLDAHDWQANDFAAVTRPAQNNDTQRWILDRI